MGIFNDPVILAVTKWARKEIPTVWQHNAPYVWWGEALKAGACSIDEYESAKGSYGPLWDYVGD